MAAIRTNKGDSVTLSEVISGLDSLSGYSAKLYIYTLAGVEYKTIDGTINSLTISYTMLNEVTKLLTVGRYKFETKIWDTSDHVYTPSSGLFVITTVLNSDPS